MGESIWVVARELIAPNHERERKQRNKNFKLKRRKGFFYSSQNLQNKEKRKSEYISLVVKKLKQNQGVCSPVQDQGRAALSPVSPVLFVICLAIYKFGDVKFVWKQIKMPTKTLYVPFNFFWKLLSRQSFRWHSALLFPRFSLFFFSFPQLPLLLIH